MALLIPFGFNSFIGGFVGDANNNQISLYNCKNSISGLVYSDGILGGAVGRLYQQLSIYGLATIFSHQSNYSNPTIVNVVPGVFARQCDNCYANTSALHVYTYQIINQTTTFNLSNDSWNTNTSTGVPQLNITLQPLVQNFTVFPQSNITCDEALQYSPCGQNAICSVQLLQTVPIYMCKCMDGYIVINGLCGPSTCLDALGLVCGGDTEQCSIQSNSCGGSVVAQSKSNLGLIIAIAAVGLALLILLVLLFVWLKRRKQNEKKVLRISQLSKTTKTMASKSSLDETFTINKMSNDSQASIL